MRHWSQPETIFAPGEGLCDHYMQLNCLGMDNDRYTNDGTHQIE